MDEVKNYKLEHIFNKEKKLEWWGQGEWVDEADECTFEYFGMKCRIIRIAILERPEVGDYFGGYLNGYVKLPENHPDYGKDVFKDELGYDVHGGLTFGEYGEYGESGYWIGFDCAHSFDITPSMIEFYKKTREDIAKKIPGISNSSIFDQTYKNFNYVFQETKSLAEQVANKMNTN